MFTCPIIEVQRLVFTCFIREVQSHIGVAIASSPFDRVQQVDDRAAGVTYQALVVAVFDRDEHGHNMDIYIHSIYLVLVLSR